ncbi:Probable glycosyltransferase At5g20260 [Linum grandiflorum]
MAEQGCSSGGRPILTLFPIFLVVLFLLFTVTPFSDDNFSRLVSYLNLSNVTEHSISEAQPLVMEGNGNVVGNTTTGHIMDKFSEVGDQKNEDTNMIKIEQDLARSRAAIGQAIRTKSFKSYKEEDFIPRGPVYRNPYAFQQSHIEMVKRFKIWSYKEGEKPLVHQAPMNNIYSIEGQFLDEMESGKSPFQANFPEEAHMFYLPFSVASIVHYIYIPILSQKDYDRDRLYRIVTDYVNVVAHKYRFWNRSTGADHFMLSCHDWGPEVSTANPQRYSEFIRVLCNANTSEGFKPSRDASLPEVYLEHGRLNPLHVGQDSSNRTILAFFAGGIHGYIRQIMFEHWKENDDQVQVFEKLPKRSSYNTKMGQSKFCLCPSGYEVASPRIVEAINQGCIPVLISKNYSLPFAEVLDWDKFTVTIPVERIGDIKNVLEGISEQKYLEMYERVKSVRRHFVLNRPAKPYDLLHMVIHSLWLRRLNIKLL